MKALNWKAVPLSLSEAREELRKLERMAADPKRRSEVDLEIVLAN